MTQLQKGDGGLQAPSMPPLLSVQRIQDALMLYSQNLLTQRPINDNQLKQIAEELSRLSRDLARHQEMRHDQLRYIWHTMVNKLTAMYGCIERMNLNRSVGDQEQQLRVLAREIDILNHLAAELQRLDRREQGKSDEDEPPGPQLHREILDLTELTREIVTMHQQQIQGSIRLNFLVDYPYPVYVSVDRERIQEVIEELIRNARRYVRQDRGGLIDVSIESDTAEVRLSVQDNGRGIDPHIQNRVFDSSFVFEGRTGQGLAIVRRTIKWHEGDIELESKPKKGSRFTIRLKRVNSPTKTTEGKEPAHRAAPGKEQVQSRRSGHIFQIGRPIRLGTNVSQIRSYQSLDDQRRLRWIKRASLTDQQGIEQLTHEKRLLERLNHQRLVQIIDWGTVLDLYGQKTARFIVLDPVPGDALDRILELGSLPVERVLTVALHLAELMVYFHSKGIFLRTLQPAAIYSEHQNTTLVDVGQLWDEAMPLLDSDSPYDVCYVAPEQVGGVRPGPISDIYVYGVVLFEAITGRPPFWSTQPEKVFMDRVTLPLPDFSSQYPDVPEALLQLVGRCLGRSPLDRYQSAAVLLKDIRAIAESARIGTLHISR